MIVRRPRCKPPVFCLIHFKARRPEIPIIAGRTYRFPYHTLLSPICQQRAACRRGHADAAVHLASSSNSRATGCAATIEAARGLYRLPASTRKFSVQPFFKRLVGLEGAKPLPRPPQRAKHLMIQRDQEGEKKCPGGTFFRGGTLSRGSPARRSLANSSH